MLNSSHRSLSWAVNQKKARKNRSLTSLAATCFKLNGSLFHDRILGDIAALLPIEVVIGNLGRIAYCSHSTWVQALKKLFYSRCLFCSQPFMRGVSGSQQGQKMSSNPPTLGMFRTTTDSSSKKNTAVASYLAIHKLGITRWQLYSAVVLYQVVSMLWQTCEN